MNEILTETSEMPSDSGFCLDLLDAAEDESIDESTEEVSEEPATVSRTLAIDATPDIAPFQLDQELLFRDLIAQHQRRLYRFVIKYIDHPDDAADITQQAFVEAARTIASFRGDSKLSTWLFGIAMNMVRNYLIARYTVTSSTISNIIKEMADSLKGVAAKIG